MRYGGKDDCTPGAWSDKRTLWEAVQHNPFVIATICMPAMTSKALFGIARLSIPATYCGHTASADMEHREAIPPTAGRRSSRRCIKDPKGPQCFLQDLKNICMFRKDGLLTDSEFQHAKSLLYHQTLVSMRSMVCE